MNLLKLTRPALLLSFCLTATATVRYVDLNSPNPTLPFTDWTTAATNIQDAIDTSVAGDLIWVTNGVYATGGKTSGTTLTNRVTLDKALSVQSVNGPNFTVIQGAWDPVTTNGPLPVRCAWPTNGSPLTGSMWRGGATLGLANSTESLGGGVFAAYTSMSNVFVTNCVLLGNAAYSSGGGAYGITLMNCTLSGNTAWGATSTATGASIGGGAAVCVLSNCMVTANSANSGGGVAYCTAQNCALRGNVATQSGGGAYRGTLINCTVS